MEDKRERTKIAIVGAGIAGMTLAAVLRHSKFQPEIHVFERDTRDRDQGTGFDIGKKGWDFNNIKREN